MRLTLGTDDSRVGSSGRRRSVTWIAAGIGVVAIAACALSVLPALIGADGSTSKVQPTPVPEIVLPADVESVCGLNGYEVTGTVRTGPSPVTWMTVGVMGAPSSASAGPGVIDAKTGYRSCFAHTVEGAVLAAVNMWAMASDPGLQPLLAEHGTTGPGHDELVQRAQSGEVSGRWQLAGFRVLLYDGVNATIDVALNLTFPDGRTQLSSIPAVLQWAKRDWKLLVTTGELPYSPVGLASLGGYVPWAQGDNR